MTSTALKNWLVTNKSPAMVGILGGSIPSSGIAVQGAYIKAKAPRAASGKQSRRTAQQGDADKRITSRKSAAQAHGKTGSRNSADSVSNPYWTHQRFREAWRGLIPPDIKAAHAPIKANFRCFSILIMLHFLRGKPKPGRPALFFGERYALQTKERRARDMVTFSDLFQFCMLIIALVGLIYEILKDRK